MKEEYRPHGFWRITGSIIAGVFIAAAFAVVFGALVMVLWNWLMPAIFGLVTIDYWQGFGLVLLVKLLFGGIGHRSMEPGKPKGPDVHGHGREGCGPERAREWRGWYDSRYWYNYSRRPGRDGHFDDVYEDWWKKEGAASFDTFMKQKEAEKAGDKAENKAEEKKDE